MTASRVMLPMISISLYPEGESAQSIISLQVNSWVTTVMAQNVCGREIRPIL